jgi:hypothetical protein
MLIVPVALEITPDRFPVTPLVLPKVSVQVPATAFPTIPGPVIAPKDVLNPFIAKEVLAATLRFRSEFGNVAVTAPIFNWAGFVPTFIVMFPVKPLVLVLLNVKAWAVVVGVLFPDKSIRLPEPVNTPVKVQHACPAPPPVPPVMFKSLFNVILLLTGIVLAEFRFRIVAVPAV